MIRRDMWVRTSDHLVLGEPALLQGSEHSERIHVIIREEHIVDNSLKIISVNKDKEGSLKTSAAPELNASDKIF